MGLINFVRDYERLARFRLGTFEGMMGPGIVFAIPVIHQIQKIDTRVTVLDIPRQTNITKDNAPLDVDFLVYLRVDLDNARKAVLEVAPICLKKYVRKGRRFCSILSFFVAATRIFIIA